MSTASGPGSRAVAQHSSQIVKSEDPERRRPVAEALGVGQRLGHAAPREPRARPAGGAAERAPWAQQPEDVAEEQRDERDADPEADVDRGRREVVLLDVRAGEPGVHGDREGADADGAEQDLHDERHARQRPLGHRLQPRARPAGRQRQERDHQDGGRGGGEQLLGDREVGAADDPVRDDPHEAVSLGSVRGPERRRPRSGSGAAGPATSALRRYFLQGAPAVAVTFSAFGGPGFGWKPISSLKGCSPSLGQPVLVIRLLSPRFL